MTCLEVTANHHRGRINRWMPHTDRCRRSRLTSCSYRWGNRIFLGVYFAFTLTPRVFSCNVDLGVAFCAIGHVVHRAIRVLLRIWSPASLKGVSTTSSRVCRFCNLLPYCRRRRRLALMSLELGLDLQGHKGETTAEE